MRTPRTLPRSARVSAPAAAPAAAPVSAAVKVPGNLVGKNLVAVENELRADEPQPSLERERALASAPAVSDDGFAVPSPQA